MSEANTPDNHQDLPEPTGSAAQSWFSGWGDFSVNSDSSSNAAEPASEPEGGDWQDWQTVDFPGAMKVEAIEQQTPQSENADQANWAVQAAPSPAIDLPPWAQSEMEPTGDQPQIADLISLIQELNQCNSALIDRVTQLEDALDRSESALQVEMGRSQEHSSISSEELTAAQEQIAQLSSQLEVSQQTSQRQQMLIETLTTHFEASQERAAQLERECASLQQRYSEQAHLLTKSETICRDLHVRLQRQQRYTLQFKAALEKCLEVPPLNYEPVVEASSAVSHTAAPVLQPLQETRSNLTTQPFLPKVQRIQPWSSVQVQPLAGKMKLEALVNAQRDAQSASDADVELNEGDALHDTIATSEPVASTPIVELPMQPVPIEAVETAAPPAAPAPQPAVAAESTPTAPTPISLSDQGISALMQPLAHLSPEAVQAGLAELKSALGDLWTGQPDAMTEDAEAALWQDLAKLIDVSTEDVLKASKAGDFATFEADDFDRPQAELDVEASKPPTVEQKPAPKPISRNQEPQLPLAKLTQTLAVQQRESAPELAATMSGVGSPSPVVYPLRPSKKLESLAAVDLPTFPRPK